TSNTEFYAGSLSNTIPLPSIPTTTAVTSSQNPSQFNQPVTFTATVTANAEGTPTGTVNFTDNGTIIAGCGEVQLVPQENGSAATCQTSRLTVGSHTIIATYSGDQNFTGSNGMLIQEVNQPTTTDLSVAPKLASAGQVVTLTASVFFDDGQPVTVGTVTFSSGDQVLGTVQLVQGGEQRGTAILKTRFAPGTFTLTASFNGALSFQSSQSQPQQLTVTGTEPTITTLTAQPDGSNYDFTASVFGFGFPPPTGSATVNDLTLGGFLLGNIGLAAPGQSSFLGGTNFAAGALP